MPNPWLLASRPKTLPAAFIPVLLGSALAAHEGSFALVPAALALLFSLLVQIGTNYANDYYDFVKGADTPDRVGPTRATAAGLVKPTEMRAAMWIVFALSFAVGCGLIPFGGWGLLVVGLASIVAGWAYTGGPYPLGYNGLGDVFVFFFFGFVATMMTFVVQVGEATGPQLAAAFWLSMVPGTLATNILVVNNLRDIGTDAITGKRTLVVRLGRTFGVRQYQALVLLAAVAPVVLVVNFDHGIAVLLPWLSLPLGGRLALTMGGHADRGGWLKRLGLTALFMLLYGLLLAVGLVVDGVTRA